MEFMNLQDFKENPDKLFFTFMGEIEAPGPLSGLGKTLDAYCTEHRILSGWSRFSLPTPVDIVRSGLQGKIAVQGLYAVMSSRENSPRFRYAANNRYLYRLHVLIASKGSTRGGVFSFNHVITEELRLFLAHPRDDHQDPFLDLTGAVLEYSWQDSERTRETLKSAINSYVPQLFLPYLLG